VRLIEHLFCYDKDNKGGARHENICICDFVLYAVLCDEGSGDRRCTFRRGILMEENTNMSLAGLIVCGIMKLLWYLFLATAGILIFITMVLWEASKPNKNNGY
jgi:hypothetical protein